MRVALLSFAVPWEARPTNGLYNVHQGAALRSIGVETELFSIAPALPRWTARLGGSFRRQLDRPDRYEVEGVPIHTVRAPAAYPKLLRERICPAHPGLVAAGFAAAVRLRLEAALDTFAPDLVLAHGVMPWSSFVGRYVSSRRIRAMYIEHSFDDVHRVTTNRKLREHYCKAAEHAHAVVTVSDAQRRMLSGAGVRNAAVAANGVRWKPRDGDPMEPESCERSEKLVLCAGAYHERKGHAYLLEGLAVSGRRDLRLRMAGEPPASIRALVRSLGLEDRVEFVGSMPHEELLSAMERADLFALPSWNESFGLVFVEALAMGTPVLMTSSAGAADVLDESDPVWSVPPRDAGAVGSALAAFADSDASKLAASSERAAARLRASLTWRANAERIRDLAEAPARACASEKSLSRGRVIAGSL